MADEPKLFAGKPGPGRPKGVPNKTTLAAKEAIAAAFDKMGGVDALVTWATKNDDNRKAFYSQIWPKIVPLQVGGDPNNPLRAVTLVELVAPQMQDGGYLTTDADGIYLTGPGESAH